MVVSGCLGYWIFTSLLLLSSWRQCNGTTVTMPFSLSPADISVDRGGDVSFSCTYPHVDVSISWNGPGVEEDDGTCIVTMSTETNTKTCTLMITNVSNSHTGKYFCTARFNNGTMVNSTVGTLSVNYVTVRIQFKSDVIIARENQPIEVPINVTVFGSPINNPYLLLHYGEAATTTNKPINKTNGTQILQISTIQLTCMTSPVLVRATTDSPLVELQGNNTVSIHIVPTMRVCVDLPAMPNITNTMASSTSITITWDQNTTSGVIWYELRYNFTIRGCEIKQSDNYTINTIEGSRRNYTVENSTTTPVEEYSAYTIFLSANNFDGASDTSIMEVSTQQYTPSGAPQNLRVNLTDDTTITIEWEPVECRHRNGEITGYNVTYFHGTDVNQMTLMLPESEHTFTATRLIFNTMYTFKVAALSQQYGAGPSATAMATTLPVQGIGFVFGGRSYRNHSIVNLNMVDETILTCHTNKMNCCRFPGFGGIGEWLLPDGSTVGPQAMGGDFYRNRGPGVVKLNWRQNVVIPTGVFCCKIPGDPYQKACIGVYPENMGIPDIQAVIDDPDRNKLVCTSFGGPATVVTWKKNGQLLTTMETAYQQNQRLIFTENATYENTLSIPRDTIADYDTTYECLVANSRGNDSSIISLEAVQIVHHGNFSVGKEASLMCSSPIDVDIIEWLNSNGEVIASLTNTKRLTLTFAPVNTSINNQMYTCRVNKSASVNKTITISVTVENPLEVVIGGPSSVVDIGERATINCTATTIAGVSQLPTLTLTHPNGTNLISTEGKMASIILDPVEVEDAGEYTCTGEIHLENITSAIVQVKQNFTFKLPTLMIDVAYNERSLEVGSSIILSCTVTNYGITDIGVLINITWSRSGIVLSNDSDRVVILNIKNSSTSTSQLTLSPLSANDDNITCSVNVELATPNSFIEMTPTVSKQVQLTIEEPDVMVLIASGSTFEGRNESAGTNFSLICMVGGIENFRPELSFEWNHSDGTFFEEINITSNEIHFSPLKLSEAGIYMCQVNVRSSLLRSDLRFMSMPPYIIRAFVPTPVVTAILSSRDIFVGSYPTVTCVAEFDESIDLPLNVMIVYSVGANLIDSIHSVHMENYMRYTRTFTIDNIQANQMGTCSFQSLYSGLEQSEFILDNPMDIAYASVNISINAAIITEITSSGENIVGEQYNLTCTIVISGIHDTPRVNISWNSTIPADTISYDNRTYISVLQFDPLQESHHDHYQCSVAVADIVREKSFYLNVQAPIVYATASGSESAPVVGQSYTLSCSVSGDEMLDSSETYQWIKYEESGMETPLETVSEILTFSSLNLSNSGNYSCSAVISSSYLDNSISANSNLVSIILQAPPPSAVVLMSLTGNILFAGNVFSVACTVSLPPTVDIPVNVNIEWSEPAGATLNYTSPMKTDNPNEYISIADVDSNVQSERISFQCAASLDSDSPFIITASESRAEYVSVLVVGRPSQPTGLNISVDSTNIELTWSTREGDIVYGYEFEYDYHIRQCPSNTPGMMRSINIANSTTSYTLEHLEEDSEFNISLIAFNPAGRSKPANLVATTLPSAPSGAPQGLNITHFDFTNVTIEWNPVECSQRNGEIDGYSLIYYPTMDSSDNESILIDGSNTNHFTIVGLRPRVNYTLNLGAIGRNYTFYDEESSRMVQTSVPLAVGILFHGKVYGNNGIVSLGDIGEGGRALFCVTSETGCCRDASIPTEMRKWYFPNGSAVSIKGAGHSFYRDRDPSIVRLNRRYNATSPNGIFLCIIPSSITPLMTSTIHIGIYDIGQGIPQISSFTFNRSSKSLNCTSLGGPVTTVTWKINNQRLEIDGNRYQQTQVIVDSETAVYTNILYSNDVSNLIGVFTCIVQNARGSNNKTISTNGVIIENIAEAYTVGSNASITCRSDADAERMEWLTQEGTVMHVVVSESNVTQLNLTFTPVNDNIHGQVYICRVIRNSNDIPEQNFTMNVEVPAAEMVLELNIIPMRSTSIAGESISFMCTVTKNISGLEHQPLAVWVENRTALTEQSESNVNLTFNQLNTSHGKVYTCRGTLPSPALPTPLVVMENHSLIVQIPTPSINVTLSSSTVYAGTNLSVICDISINTAVDSDISVNVTWFNGSTLISNETERVSVLPLAGTKPSYTSNLLIFPLIDVDNTSNFSCQASVHSDSVFIQQSNVGEGSIHIPVQQRNNESGTETTMATVPATTTSTSTTDELVTAMTTMTTMSATNASDDTDVNNDLLLQLRLFEVQNCLEWVSLNANIKVNDISTAIVSNINQRCQCGLSHENITNGVLHCFPASPQAVTFRAILHGGTKASNSELSSYIERWIRNDVKIPVQSVLINVDSSCMVAISSFDDGECQIDSEKHTNNSSSAVIGGTVAGLLLLLILSSAVVIALLIMLWRRKKHHGRDSNTRMQMTEANLTHSPAHDYEAIDKYTKEYEDIVEMDLTKCPAYEPIKQT